MSASDYSASVEDYLKAIYLLSRDSADASASAVADHLRVARASVSVMARRLVEQGLVEHEAYRGLRLTEAGRRVALRLVRRHRIIEAYLVAVLGYTWDAVHDEAERLEHAVSDDLVDRMATAIGDPPVDPHGAPIPTRQGAVAAPAYRALGALAPGETARVARVEDDDPGLLRYLASLGLVPGAAVTCVARAPFDGPLSVRVGADTHAIGPGLAAQVLLAADARADDAEAGSR